MDPTAALDDLSSSSVDALVRDAWAQGARLGPGPTDRQVAEAGVDPSRFGPGVFMDSTTISGVLALLSPARVVGPMFFWDLATLATNVVCHDKVYVLDAPRQSFMNVGRTLASGIDTGRLNRLLGDDVFVPVAVSTTNESEGSAGPGVPDHLVLRCWAAARDPLASLREHAGRDTLGGRELETMRSTWSKALGAEVTTADLVQPLDLGRREREWYAFPGGYESLHPLFADDRDVIPTLLLNAVGQEELVVDGVWVRSDVRFAAAGDEGRIQGPPGGMAFVISELNYRAHFNLRVAHALRLPYGCGLSRMPYRRLHVARALQVQDALYSALAADDAYRDLAERMVPRGAIRLVLPVFAALPLS
jgi:hypothetical protein